MTSKKTIIAIDPGKSGGIATFSNGRIQAVKMPENVRELKKYLEFQIETYGESIVFIEKVQAFRGKTLDELKDDILSLHKNVNNSDHFFNELKYLINGQDDAPGKKFGINKMLNNYSELLTVIKLLGIPFVEVYPISWQSTLGLKMHKEKITKTERKNRYKKYAENSFPEIKKVTLAISDALCLVQFALHKYLHEPRWIHEKIQNNKVDNLFN